MVADECDDDMTTLQAVAPAIGCDRRQCRIRPVTHFPGQLLYTLSRRRGDAGMIPQGKRDCRLGDAELFRQRPHGDASIREIRHKSSGVVSRE